MSRSTPGPDLEVPQDLPSMEPGASLRERVLGLARPETRLDGFLDRLGRLFDLPETRAREILSAADPERAAGWVDGPAPGLRLYHLQGGESVAGADCGLIHLAPGAAAPRHRHGGVEIVLALSGRAEEDSGEVWEPGDLVVREADSSHGFRALGDEPFVFAVVLRGGLELAPDS